MLWSLIPATEDSVISCLNVIYDRHAYCGLLLHLCSSFICFSVADNEPHGTLQNRLNAQIQAATEVQGWLHTPQGQQHSSVSVVVMRRSK